VSCHAGPVRQDGLRGQVLEEDAVRQRPRLDKHLKPQVEPQLSLSAGHLRGAPHLLEGVDPLPLLYQMLVRRAIPPPRRLSLPGCPLLPAGRRILQHCVRNDSQRLVSAVTRCGTGTRDGCGVDKCNDEREVTTINHRRKRSLGEGPRGKRRTWATHWQ